LNPGTRATIPNCLSGFVLANQLITESLSRSSLISDGIKIIFSPDQARSVFAKGLETDSISNPSPLIKKESSCVVADINIRLLALENVPKLSIGINVGEISNV
ncbi:hypothetical protein, partial [Thiolapillus sp.]|uniref:hypothetical protein n=1 Tax=Thiolapillus sp. TaxID=2017437 RepID=UPI0025E42CAC